MKHIWTFNKAANDGCCLPRRLILYNSRWAVPIQDAALAVWGRRKGCASVFLETKSVGCIFMLYSHSQNVFIQTNQA